MSKNKVFSVTAQTKFVRATKPAGFVCEGRQKFHTVCRRTAFGVACLLVFAVFVSFAHADPVSAAANTKLTDGSAAASTASTDSAWVFFNKDSTQLPVLAGGGPNLNMEYFGTGQYTGPASSQARVDSLMQAAGSRSARLNLLWQQFPDPKSSSPYWDWSWFDSTYDGRLINSAVNNGEMVDLIVNKTAYWADKSLPIDIVHPPEGTAIAEQVTLNGTSPVQLSHKFLMGENSPIYDKESVVASNAATQYVSETLGSGNGSAWKEFNLSHYPVVPGSMKLYVNGALWNEVDHFVSSSTSGKQNYVFFPNTGRVRFGDGWAGPTLPSGATVTVQYSYYTSPYKEYNNQFSGGSYNTSDKLDYRIDYTNGTIQRTSNSTIPSGSTVKVTYYYLDTTWWQRFWTELTAHYAGKIKYFEPLNEENLPTFFTGSQAQYAQMLRTAYAGAKAGNPNSTVILGGLGWGTTYLSDLYNMNTKNYMDALAWHPYGWQVGSDNPQSHLNLLNNTYTASAAANGDGSKPVFLNEVGFSTSTQVPQSISWDDQATALSRMYLKFARSPVVANLSWWGIVDESPVGQQEGDLYFSHMGLIAQDSSGNLTIKPSYYAFKSLGTNKGVLIDLASYNSSGTLTQGSVAVNKVSFTSMGNDLSNALIFASNKNTNDWWQVSGTNMSSVQNGNGTFTYTVVFPTTTARYIQVQFVKKSGVSQFAIDEVKVFSTSGTNISQGKLYMAAGYSNSNVYTPPSSDTTAPTQPNNLSASALDGSSVSLSWSASTDNIGVTGYEVYRNNTKVANATTASFVDTGLAASTAYSYYVKALDASGNKSGACTTVNATTMAASSPPAQTGNPVPSFTYTVDPDNQQVVLTNTTQPVQGATITGYLWYNGRTRISSSVNYNFPTAQNTDLNIGLYVYYTGGTSGYVQTAFKQFNTGSWTDAPPAQAGNPVPSFDYAVDNTTNKVTLTNTTQPVPGATITGYLWFANGTQISNLVNYNYSAPQNASLNICLYAYYTGGASGYVQSSCQTVNTGTANFSSLDTNPTPKYTYVIDTVNRTVRLTNTTDPGTATVTGYLWYNNGKQISSSVNYNYPTTPNTNLNICLYAYYTGGASGYVQQGCYQFNTGAW